MYIFPPCARWCTVQECLCRRLACACVRCGASRCHILCVSVSVFVGTYPPCALGLTIQRYVARQSAAVCVCLCVPFCVPKCPFTSPAARPVVHYTEASFLPQHAVSVSRAPHTGQQVVTDSCVSCLPSLSSVFPAVRPGVDCVAASGGSRRRCAGTSRAAAIL